MADSDVNLKALQRVDPYIVEILDSATQVALYKFNSNDNEWDKTGVEGTLFVYRRNDPLMTIRLSADFRDTPKSEQDTVSISQSDYNVQIPPWMWLVISLREEGTSSASSVGLVFMMSPARNMVCFHHVQEHAPHLVSVGIPKYCAWCTQDRVPINVPLNGHIGEYLYAAGCLPKLRPLCLFIAGLLFVVALYRRSSIVIDIKQGN